jgi:hypothetical protein
VRTAHAYLLYQGVRLIISPADLLLRANRDRIPDTVIDGFYRRVDVPLRENRIYARTGKPADRFMQDAAAFTENLAHVSRVLRATIDGRTVAADEFDRRLRFLREQQADETFSGPRQIAITFARHDEDASALYVGALSARHPATVTAALYSETGHEIYRKEIAAQPAATALLEPLPPGTRAVMLVLSTDGQNDQRLTLADVRLLGQTAALRDYVARTLTFPAR